MIGLAVIGCGSRARAYIRIAAQLPEQFITVAAADTIPGRAEIIRVLSGNPACACYSSAEELLQQPQLADIMLITSQDSDHYHHCMRAMQAGYDILLEKPIADTMPGVLQLQSFTHSLQRRVLVCHILRYAPFYKEIKELIESGLLGNIVGLNASEGIGDWHFAHSYVRGHWADTSVSTPTIVAKSCHDMDLIYWLTGRKAMFLSSYGALSHFKLENCPKGAPRFCLEGCQAAATCPYNAARYLGDKKEWLPFVYDGVWTAASETRGETKESPAAEQAVPNRAGASEAVDRSAREWLLSSPWGRCVYQCENNAPDHQTVNLLLEGGISATFTMTAYEDDRHIEVFGTKARLRGGRFVYQSTGHSIQIIHHSSGKIESWSPSAANAGGYESHGGGDEGLIRNLAHEMTSKNAFHMHTSIDTSIQSHLMAFAADESRRTGRTVDIQQYRAELENNLNSGW